MIRALDLFCCAGGATNGLQQVGFHVTGIDINHQKHYCGDKFIQADVTTLDVEFLKQFDFIWASPPCQAYSLSSMQWRNKGKEYPDLIASTRELLIKSGKPYVIENVEGAPLNSPILLCGSMFGLRTYRHRLFESNFYIKQPIHEKHKHPSAKMGRPVKDNEFMTIAGHFSNVKLGKEIMQMPWANQYELAQAIPPVYSKYIAEQFLKSLIYWR